MKNSSLKENFNFYTNIGILFFLFFATIIYADTNGIWHDAEDLRGGIIGGDEQPDTTSFTFMNPTFFLNNVQIGETNSSSNLTVKGDIISEGQVYSNGNKVQEIISDSCPDGKAIKQVNPDGTVVCQDAGGLDNVFVVGYQNYGEDVYRQLGRVCGTTVSCMQQEVDTCTGISYWTAANDRQSGFPVWNQFIGGKGCSTTEISGPCIDMYRGSDGYIHKREVTCKRVSVIGLIDG